MRNAGHGSTVRQLLTDIARSGAFKDKTRSTDGKGFKLKLHEKHPEAPLSPFYLNLRTPDNPKPGPLTQDLIDRIGTIMCFYVWTLGWRFTHVAGIPHAGTPFAEAFVRAARVANPPRDLPLLSFEKITGSSDRRIGKLIGEVAKDGRVLLIDDLITAADSKLEAIDAIEQRCSVAGIAVLVDREQGGMNDLRERGYEVTSVVTIRKLVNVLSAENLMGIQTRDEILAYLTS